MEQQDKTTTENISHLTYLQNIVEKLINEEELPEKLHPFLTQNLDQTLIGL